jgi:hypothetical protein
MHYEGKWKLRSHNTSYCLIEVVTKADFTIHINKRYKKYFYVSCIIDAFSFCLFFEILFLEFNFNLIFVFGKIFRCGCITELDVCSLVQDVFSKQLTSSVL